MCVRKAVLAQEPEIHPLEAESVGELFYSGMSAEGRGKNGQGGKGG